MAKRSSKQLKADLGKINLESKTTRQAQNLIAKQYNKLGRKIPQKIQNETATMRDMERYMRTLNNAVDRRITRELVKEPKTQKKLNRLNRLQDARREAMEGILKGYDKNFVKGYVSGKVAVLGRNLTTSMIPTTRYSEVKAARVAALNNKSVGEWLDIKIEAMEKDLEDIKSLENRDYSYLIDDLRSLVEIEGYTLSDKNENKLRNALKGLDFLGAERLIKVVNQKLEDSFYRAYKMDLEENDNEELVESLRQDIIHARKINTSEKIRIAFE